MNTIFVIAGNTFKQAIRDKILYGIIIFGLLFIGSTVIISSLALGENVFIIRSLGLAGIYLFGLIITIFLGASLIYDEIEKRTTYILLSKPVTRFNIILGKFLGLLAGIALMVFLMTLAYSAVIFFNGGGIDTAAFLVIGLQLFEMALIITLLILFSVITTPLASTIYTILILYIGHSLSYIFNYAQNLQGAGKTALLAIYYILPNLEKFNIRNLVVHNVSPSPLEVLTSCAYAIIYISFLIYFSHLIFKRKDV